MEKNMKHYNIEQNMRYLQLLSQSFPTIAEIISSACADNRINNDIDIGSLVMIFSMLVQKFLDDVREIAWQ